MTSRAGGHANPRPRVGLRRRMAKVVGALRRVKASADADAVHDLRVAIRHCRSVAAMLQEVDGHPGWRRARRLPRRLFAALGELRDLHVRQDWIVRLTPEADPLRVRLLAHLGQLEAAAHAGIRRAADDFDTKAWGRLAEALPKRARLVTANGLAAQCLALERVEALGRLHARVARREGPAPWHALRIALKRFRYGVEILLPARSAVWAARLGRLQDLLGDIQDLDVLASWLGQEVDDADRESIQSLRRTIAVERHARVEQYRQLTSGDQSPFREWRAGLPEGSAAAGAASARLRVTARAMDPHPRRTAAVSRLVLHLFDGLAESSVEAAFHAHRARLVLHTAALLHGIRFGGRGAPHKAASAFLRSAPAPPAWKASDWVLVAHVVRYQRGAEPQPRHRRFSVLSAEEQRLVRALAGVLRLARTLQRCGASGVGRVGADAAARCLRLRVAGVPDTAEHAARLAFAKHLLEAQLACPMMIDLAPADDSASLGGLAVASPIRPTGARLIHRL